jgi:hypothetical protein
MVGRQELILGDIEQHTAANEGSESFDPVLAESDRSLDARVDVNAAVQHQVLSLVSQGIDVCAGMLWHDDQARRARSSLRRATGMVAVQEVVETWGVGRVRWCAGEPRLFEIEDSG